MATRPSTIVLLLLTALAAGCGGGGDSRRAVQGTVTLDGRPLSEGTIVFLPASGADGATSGGPIRDGRFALPAARGLVPGDYRVQIRAYDLAARPANAPSDPLAPRTPQKVPIRFRQPASLLAHVASSGENTFTFDMHRASRGR
jgi:hypothetical protein